MEFSSIGLIFENLSDVLGKHGFGNHDMYLVLKEIIAYHIMPNRFITSRLII